MGRLATDYGNHLRHARTAFVWFYLMSFVEEKPAATPGWRTHRERGLLGAVWLLSTTRRLSMLPEEGKGKCPPQNVRMREEQSSSLRMSKKPRGASPAAATRGRSGDGYAACVLALGSRGARGGGPPAPVCSSDSSATTARTPARSRALSGKRPGRKLPCAKGTSTNLAGQSAPP